MRVRHGGALWARFWLNRLPAVAPCYGVHRITWSAGCCRVFSLPKLLPLAGEVYAAKAVAVLIPGRPLALHYSELNICYPM